MRTFCVMMILAAGIGVAAAGDIRSERVKFEPGANAAHVAGSIKGYKIVDYILSASKGQYMNVSMATKNSSAYFNILAPGSEDAAFFIGSTSGNQYEGVASETGDYRVRVYLMRNAARRGAVAKYKLELVVGSGPK